MATFWNGIVNTTNGNDTIVVVSGDDINLISERSLLQVEGGQVVEVVRAYGTTIELALPWGGSTASNRDAIAVPTAGNLAEASERLRTLGDQATTILDNALTEEVNDLTTNVTWATVPDAYVSGSSVKQYATSSKWSVSAGELIKVGDYGLGVGPLEMSNVNYNNLTAPGKYFIGQTGSSNGPANANFMVDVTSASSTNDNNRSFQMAFGYFGESMGNMYIRSIFFGDSSGWGKVNHSAKPNTLPTYTVSGLPAGSERDIVYCSNGDAGAKCLAVHDGTSWKRVALGATVSAT